MVAAGMRKNLVGCSVLVAFAVAGLGCGDGGDEDGEKAKVGLRVRPTGDSLAFRAWGHLLDRSALTALATLETRNVVADLDYYKVPIDRINLVNGLKGTAYKGSSAPLYKCSAPTDKECLVNLASKTQVDNLLKATGSEEPKESEAKGATNSELEVKTYNGVAVEFCHEHDAEAEGGDANSYYEVRIKGRVSLGGTTYYTNSQDGLSTESPAEKVVIPVKDSGCGVTTPLIEKVELKEGETTNVVLYTDPAGAVFATDDPAAANSSCKGTGNAVCADPVAVYGTVSKAEPTIERYKLAFDGSWMPVMGTFMYDDDDTAFGAMFRHLYDDSNKDNPLHSSVSIRRIETHDDGTLTLKTFTDENAKAPFIENFERGDHSGTILEYVDSAAADYTATRL